MPITKSIFGQLPDRTSVELFTLKNSNGLSAGIMTFGATLVSMKTPDRDGHVGDITLGHDTLQGYIDQRNYFGVICGRVANRIAKGKFKIDGKEFQVAQNHENYNHLHGGEKGFDRVIWKAESMESDDSVKVVMKYHSPDGEEHYPGSLDVTVEYILTNENELIIDYKAVTDAPTIINLTNHTYWNLAEYGNILNHELQLNCSHYLPVDNTCIPTGEIASVQETPMDFLCLKSIQKDIDQTAGGYDLCFVVDKQDDNLAVAAIVKDPASGRQMEISTTKPGIQLYTGNFLKDISGKQETIYQKHSAFCLETEYFPDAINHDNFFSPVLRPGERYHHITKHCFFTES